MGVKYLKTKIKTQPPCHQTLTRILAFVFKKKSENK